MAAKEMADPARDAIPLNGSGNVGAVHGRRI
jgi:hypothetical protein